MAYQSNRLRVRALATPICRGLASQEGDFAEVDDRYMAIILKAEELDEYRTQRRESRGRWVGGGFGIGGAVKGAMQAGAMSVHATMVIEFACTLH